MIEESHDLSDIVRSRNRCSGEVFPEALVGLRRQQHGLGMLNGPTGSTHLLVVGDW